MEAAIRSAPQAGRIGNDRFPPLSRHLSLYPLPSPARSAPVARSNRGDFMRKLGLVAAATLALLGSAASAKTTVIYAARVLTDTSKPAHDPSTATVTDDRITSIAHCRPQPAAGPTPPP